MKATSRQSPFLAESRTPAAQDASPDKVKVDVDMVTRRSLQLNQSYSTEHTALAYANELMPDGGIAPTGRLSSSQPAQNKSFAFRVAEGLVDTSSSDSSQEVHITVPGEEADVSKLMEPIASDNQLVLSFHRISGWVPLLAENAGLVDKWKKLRARKRANASAKDGNGDIDSKQALANAVVTAPVESPKARRQVLYDLSGKVNPGELLALMGPSGSGKTTLLSVIGGRTPKLMKRTGQVLVNGQPFTKLTRRQIGFVLQDDVLYETLTVQETLQYAAMLRLPGDMPPAEKIERANAVITALGLTKSKGTIIGGYFRRGLSGGERKRVSIGTEMLINPAILMLDEPTSGLDSTTAMHLITLLKQLAAGGRAILTTIHQPSSRLYEQLDQLMLLAEGHAMYYGNAQLVADWFQHLGFKLRFGISMSDFILDVAQGEVESNSVSGTAAIKALNATFEKWYQDNPEGFQDRAVLATIEELANPDEGVMEGSFRGVKKNLTQIDLEKKKKLEANGQVSSVPSFSRWSSFALTDVFDSTWNGTERRGLARLLWGRTPRVGASYSQQFSILLQRSARVRRFESLTFNNMFTLVAVALICGLLWWQKGQDDTIQAGNDMLGLIFFEELFLAMRTLFSALFTFPEEFRMLTKERASGMYKVSAYYLARTSVDLPFEMFFSTVFVTIVYFFGGLRLTPAAYFANLFTMLLTVLVSQSWGLLMGGIFMHPKQAQTFTTVMMLTFLLVGGFYVRSIPFWIDWIKYLSFLYWAFNVLLKIEYSGRSLRDCSSGVCKTYDDIQKALRLPSSPNASPALDIAMLFLMLIVLRITIYFVLRKKTASLGK